VLLCRIAFEATSSGLTGKSNRPSVDGWPSSRAPSMDGLVKPADSLHSPHLCEGKAAISFATRSSLEEAL